MKEGWLGNRNRGSCREQHVARGSMPRPNPLTRRRGHWTTSGAGEKPFWLAAAGLGSRPVLVLARADSRGRAWGFGIGAEAVTRVARGFPVPLPWVSVSPKAAEQQFGTDVAVPLWMVRFTDPGGFGPGGKCLAVWALCLQGHSIRDPSVSPG